MRNKQIEDRKFEFSQTTEKIERIEPQGFEANNPITNMEKGQETEGAAMRLWDKIING